MVNWIFKVFKGAGIEEWLTSLPANIETKFRILLSYMATAQEQWSRPYFGKLTRYKNLYEIRVTGSIQYRLLGCYGPNRHEFTLLIGATKAGASKGKSATWNPKNALEIADKRSKLIAENGRYADEYER